MLLKNDLISWFSGSYPVMSSPLYILFFFLLTVLYGCGDNSLNSVGDLQTSSNWQRQPFLKTEIYSITNTKNEVLLATHEGLFSLRGDKVFDLGLNDKQVIGVTKLPGERYLASVQSSDFSGGEITLFRSGKNTNNWQAFINNFGDDGEYTLIDAGPVGLQVPSDTVFIRGNIAVARSFNGGMQWELTFSSWDGFGGAGRLIKPDPFHPGRIWAGGVGAFSNAYLIKSNNYGKTWETLDVDSLGDIDGILVEGVANDIMSHPQNPDRLLVGFTNGFKNADRGNVIKKSVNGGTNWQVVLTQTAVTSMVRSVRNPDIIYASGFDETGNVFFALTNDFGETWEKNIFENGPENVFVRDVVVRIINQQEVLLFGTTDGLFTFTFNN